MATKKRSTEIIESVKKQERLNSRKNFTFRLKESLIEDFKKKCAERNVSMTSVLEELLNHFNNN